MGLGGCGLILAPATDGSCNPKHVSYFPCPFIAAVVTTPGFFLSCLQYVLLRPLVVSFSFMQYSS